MLGNVRSSLAQAFRFVAERLTASSATNNQVETNRRPTQDPSVGHVVVFVHGLGSGTEACWESFPELLRTDSELSSRYGRIETFDYPLMNSSLTDHALQLELEIEKFNRASPITSLTFIAHSQGGLLARRYLSNQLDRRARGDIQSTPLFRLLTYATPHWGAFSSWLQKAVRMVPSATQPADLGYDAPALLALNQDWARLDADAQVDMLRVIAKDDWVVPEFSALDANYKNRHRLVPGHGHISIVKVTDRNHPSSAIAKEFLSQTPSSHPQMRTADHTVPVLKHGLLQSENIGSESQRLLYLARWIPLLGREAEWRELEQFVAQPMRADHKSVGSAAAWLWMESEGGVGKSRLALELCLALQEADWHTGFLSRESDKQPDWTRWQPALPTLMVLDYATTDTVFLTRLLSGICQRDPGYELRHPVRVLLLDRNEKRERLSQSIGQRAINSHVHNARHHLGHGEATDCMELSAVDDPWILIVAYLKRSNNPHLMPDRESILQALIDLDPLGRPLYALMVADALTAGVNIEELKLGRESMLSAFLARERQQFCLAFGSQTYRHSGFSGSTGTGFSNETGTCGQCCRSRSQNTSFTTFLVDVGGEFRRPTVSLLRKRTE